MKKNDFRSLAAIALLVFLIAAAIVFTGTVVKRSVPATPPGPSAEDYRKVLSEQVGKEYTQKTHDSITGIIAADEELYLNISDVSRSHADVAIKGGILLGICAVASLVILVLGRMSGQGKTS